MQAQSSSLLEVLARRTEQAPDAVQFRYLRKGEVDGAIEVLSRRELLARAQALGALLTERAARGERVLLLYPPGLEIFVAFFACLHADVIAVPMTPPDPQRLGQTLPRLISIVEQSGATLVLSTSAVVNAAAPFLAAVPALAGLRFIASDTALPSSAPGGPARGAQRPPSAVAFLQYTSGSLGTPKGVMVTDASLLANLEMIRVGMCMNEQTPGAFWLPHHHDMGFIGGGLEFVYCGAPCTMMSPIAFIQRPARWLRAISRFGGVVGGGPCFAYERCVRRITDDEIEGVDLSSWRVAFVGAEPVRRNVLDRFAARFARHGFRREFFYPCYGLAEATLFVSGKPMEPTPQPPVLRQLAAAALEQNRVEPTEDPGAAPDESSATRTFVSCGAPRLAASIVIVSPETRTRARPGEIGEIWTRGPNLAAGYWNDREKTDATFGLFLKDPAEGPFLATGDLGFIADGELYVTGRSKELLILGGRNHYPQDLEETIEASHPDLRYGGSAAFSFECADEEVLAVVAEIAAERIAAEGATRREAPYQDIVSAIRAALLKHHFVVPKEIAFLPPQSLFKTTSGKKARIDTRRSFLTGSLERI